MFSGYNVSRKPKHDMKPSSFIAFAFVLTGCSGSVEVDFQVTVQSVDTIVAEASTQVICDVVVTATAVGDDGQFGRFGEADLTFRSLANGEVLRLSLIHISEPTSRTPRS